jgi:exonuclease 1
MGIQGLLKLLGDISDRKHVSAYRGKTVAVDASCWLHRAAYSCSRELVMGEPTVRYLRMCFRLTRMLVDHGIKPIIVFDGANPPLKEAEAARRRQYV